MLGQGGEAFDVVGHGEEVESSQCFQFVAMSGEEGDVAGQGGGITGDVDDLVRRQTRNLSNSWGAGSGAGRVTDDDASV